MLIDTHAHVQFAAFKGETDAILKRALDQGTWVINVGTQKDTSQAAVDVAEKYEKGVYAVIGLHPVHTYSQEVDEEESHFKTREEYFDTSLYQSMAQSRKVVGIGECGLDYYRLPVGESAIVEDIKKTQKEAFIAQIRIAKELNKALVIHCRPSVGTQDAYEDILSIIDVESYQLVGLPPDKLLRFEIHSFTGSPEIAQEFVKRGAYVGLNGIITFGERKNKNSSTSAEVLPARRSPPKADGVGAKVGDRTGNMQKVVDVIPLDRIVLETDCPYLTPVPFRGKKNEPAYVSYVAGKLAELKGVSVEEVERATTENASNLFSVDVDL
jgi:TatD DNase family protein